MKIISFNIREWHRDKDESSPYYWKKRRDSIAKMIKAENPDILCIQEGSLKMLSSLKKLGYKRVNFTVSHAIYVKRSLKAKHHRFHIFYDWCEVNGLRLINVHTRWEKWIIKKVAKGVSKLMNTDKVIACGDFNYTLESLRHFGLMSQHARTDLKVSKEDTFINFKRPTESHGEIDHFFYSGITLKSFGIIKDGYGCERMSDHYPICLTF